MRRQSCPMAGSAGGEYNQGGPQSEIAKAAIYLPTTNQWLPIRPPAGWTQIGDAESVVLPNGKWMIGNVGTQQALLNENNLTFTPTGYGLKICTNNEAGWTLLPDGSLFSVDNNISCGTSPSAERWVNGTWFPASSTGNVPQQLFDANGAEMGPQILMNNGNVLAIGATGNVSVYTPPPVQTPPSFATGSWANTTTLPALCGTSSTTQCASTDSPASMLPNGRPLLVACPVADTSVMPANEFPAGNRFFEYDTSVNPAAWNQPTYPGALKTQLNSDSCGFLARMLLLPNGQAMYVNGSKSVWFYNPKGPAPQPSWQPTITTYPATINRNTTYIISGLLFNGMSEANFYGDDTQNYTNYPIVQVTINGSGHVYYGRTHNHSSMGVAQTTLPVTTQFELWDCNPPHVVAGSACVPESGAATLVVIANGIASAPVNVTIN